MPRLGDDTADNVKEQFRAIVPVRVILLGTDLFLGGRRHEKNAAADAAASAGATRQLRHADDGRAADEPHRPDVTHQALLAVLDSPANQCGCLELWLLNKDKKLIRVNSNFRVPRTWKVFSKVMTDFLTSKDLKLRAPETGEVFLEVVPGEWPAEEAEKMAAVAAPRVLQFSNGGSFCRLRELLPRAFVSGAGEPVAPTFAIELCEDAHAFLPAALRERAVPVRVSHYGLARATIVSRVAEELGRFLLRRN